MMFKAIILSAVASVAFSAYTFPDDFATCITKSDSDCLKNQLQDAYIKFGTQGISKPIEFKINPVILPYWTTAVDSDFMKIRTYFWNLSHPTIWNWTVTSASFDFSTHTLNYTTFMEDFAQEDSYYYMWGDLYDNNQSESIHGNGTADFHVYNLTVQHVVELTTVNIDGEEYFFVKSYDLTIKKYTGAKVNFRNLYNGDDEAHAKKAASFFDKSAMKIIKNQEHVLVEMLLTMLKFNTHRIFSSVPSSRLLKWLGE